MRAHRGYGAACAGRCAIPTRPGHRRAPHRAIAECRLQSRARHAWRRAHPRVRLHARPCDGAAPASAAADDQGGEARRLQLDRRSERDSRPQASQTVQDWIPGWEPRRKQERRHAQATALPIGATGSADEELRTFQQLDHSTRLYVHFHVIMLSAARLDFAASRMRFSDDDIERGRPPLIVCHASRTRLVASPASPLPAKARRA